MGKKLKKVSKFFKKFRVKKRYVFLAVVITISFLALPTPSQAVQPIMLTLGSRRARTAFFEKETRDKIRRVVTGKTLRSNDFKRGLPRAAAGLVVSTAGNYLYPQTNGFFKEFINVVGAYGQKQFCHEYSYLQFKSPIIALGCNLLLECSIDYFIGRGTSPIFQMNYMRTITSVICIVCSDKRKSDIASVFALMDFTFYYWNNRVVHGGGYLLSWDEAKHLYELYLEGKLEI